MKKLIAIILCAVLCLGLVGCSVPANATNDTKEEETESLPRMVVVFDKNYIRIYVDTETRVMYATYVSNVGAAMTIMVDPDGKPLLWEGELK